MYGMIHRGIRAMVIEELGEAEWNRLEQELGIGPNELISMSVYDDAMTIAILSGAANRLGQSIEACLGSFGRYWVKFAERGSYGHIMDFTGRDLVGFIENLDRMHQAVLAAMPAARVPSFSVIRQGVGEVRVKYHSERSGLEPFVVGLLHGLLERFGHEGEVKQVASQSNSIEFDLVYR